MQSLAPEFETNGANAHHPAKPFSGGAQGDGSGKGGEQPGIARQSKEATSKTIS